MTAKIDIYDVLKKDESDIHKKVEGATQENQIPVRPKPPTPKQHYHQFDTLKLMEHWASPQERRGFLRFNIIKYMERYLNKGGVDDLRKAQKYLSLLIQHEASHGQPQ